MEETPATQPQSTPPAQPAPGQPSEVKPERGVMILVLGIVSIVISCLFFLGIVAWVMGNNDLKEMDEGRRDRSGRDMTKVGMICGIVGTCLGALALLMAIFWFALFGTGVLGALSHCC